jgi:dTDP-4-dehydrorhamnose 3,5-epimerase/reductase
MSTEQNQAKNSQEASRVADESGSRLAGSEVLIVGANGQLGRELQKKYPGAQKVDVKELDISSRAAVENFDWSGIKIIINAAAYTNVDGAETTEGRIAAWAINADAVANLVAVCAQHNITLIHISTDYVFDGNNAEHSEDEPFSPLSVYGASKAAGDIIVSLAPKFYILRTSWVIGEGKNFVRSIIGLNQKAIEPAVVADQFGRLTFTSELVRAIDHLLSSNCPFGTYNVSNSGTPGSWADIARQIYSELNSNLKVSDTTAEEYFAGKLAAKRPTNSTLSLEKIHATGFKSTDWKIDLKKYIMKELSNSR